MLSPTLMNAESQIEEITKHFSKDSTDGKVVWLFVEIFCCSIPRYTNLFLLPGLLHNFDHYT